MRPEGWVIDMPHSLDDATGDLPAHVPSRILNLALFFGSCMG